MLSTLTSQIVHLKHFQNSYFDDKEINFRINNFIVNHWRTKKRRQRQRESYNIAVDVVV